MKVVVTGVTKSGNLGGVAMLCAVEDVISDNVSDLVLASILPRQDMALSLANTSRIAPSDYRLWMLFVAPVCLLLWPFRRVQWVRNFLSQLPILKEFADADAVADLSGIAFVDGRGFPLIFYNLAICLPALFFHVPLHKLSQALGPFNLHVNKLFSHFVFHRCTTIAARGHQTLTHLHSSKFKSAVFRPDVSFAMKVNQSERYKAKALCRANIKSIGKRPLIIVTPSAVVSSYCTKHKIDFPRILFNTLLAIHNQGVNVAFLAHSTDTGISKNDDLSVINSIHELLGSNFEKFPVLDADNDPRLARALIAESDVFVGCRFHSMIAALSQAVPTVTIGWSHKYAEAAEPFGMDQHVLDFADINEDVTTKTKYLIDHRKILKEQMPHSERNVGAS